MAAYSQAVSSLQNSLLHLREAVTTLDEGTRDFPRLQNVLKTVRHYELVPQATLTTAQASLRDEIGPYITLLLQRAESQVQRQERRIDTLKARAELLQSRLASRQRATEAETRSVGDHHPTPRRPHVDPNTRSAGRDRRKSIFAGVDGGLDTEGKLRLRTAQQRKAALAYSVDRLSLEVQQKERELRKRLLTED